MADESDAASVVTSELATSAQRRTAAASMPSVRRYVGAILSVAILLFLFATITSTAFNRNDWLIGVPALFAAFLAVEFNPLEVEVRTGTIALPLTEIPIVAALLLVSFPAAVASSVVAVVIRAAFLGQHRVALTFNVSASTCEIALAYLIYGGAAGLGLPQPAGILVSLTVSSFVSNIFAIGLTWSMGRSRETLFRDHLAATATTMTVVSPLVVLLGVQLVRFGPTGWALLGAIVSIFAVLYHSYSKVLRERRDLDLVHKISLAVSGPEETWPDVLDLVRAQFNARRVVLTLPSTSVVFVSGESLKADDLAIYSKPDALTGLASVKACRISTTVGPSAVTSALKARGTTEALVAQLGSGVGAGILELHDRQNTIRGFGLRDVELLETLARHASTAIDNRRLVAEISHDAYHDRLTGMRNRVGFFDQVAIVREKATKASNTDVDVVFMINLGAVVRVNDALGLAWGDRLVVQAARRVRETVDETVRTEVSLARLDGDTFAGYALGIGVEEGESVAAELAIALAAPYQVDAFAAEASVAIGLAAAPTHKAGEAQVVDVNQLLQHADVAMQAARAAGESVRTYHDGMGQRFLRRFQLVTQFRAAMASGDVHVHEQPKLGLANRKVVGAEALLRWRHPVFGDVDPEELVQVLEATGLMMDLTSFVLDRSLARARHHLDQGLRIDPAVNVSVRNLLAPSFPAMVTDALERHQVPAAMLTLEITETSVMGDAERTLPALRVLHELGISLSVDDFGTGYSSLSYLRRLPVDEIKIDKSFVLGMGADLSDHAVVRSIIDLGHSLDLRVVAEGVETDVVREQLADMGCDVIQGYLVSRALEPTRFDSWLHARTYREGGGLEGPAVAPTLARPSSR